MILPFLLEKEFKQIARNPMILGVMVFFTFMVMLIFPWAINFELEKANVTVVNLDSGPYAERLIQKVDLSKTFDITSIHQSYKESYRDVNAGNASIILVIPKSFSGKIEKQEKSEIMVLINAVDAAQASVTQGYLEGLIASYTSELLTEKVGLNIEETLPIELIPEYRFNPKLDSKIAMLPAFLAMLLTMFCGIFSALSIVLERENGSLQQINVTPIKPVLYMFAKVLPFWILGVIVLGLGISIIDLIYGIKVTGSIGLLFFISLQFIVTISLFGVIISNLSETLQQAMFLIMFFILIIFLVSGLFTPVNAMPSWAQFMAYANPLTYYIDATRLIYLRGADFSDIIDDSLLLLLFFVVFSVMALVTYKKRN